MCVNCTICILQGIHKIVYYICHFEITIHVKTVIIDNSFYSKEFFGLGWGPGREKNIVLNNKYDTFFFNIKIAI